jgi:hypothetical protein
MSNNSKSLIVKANGQNFEVTVKPVKASEIVTGEGEGFAAPRPANNGRLHNVRTNVSASGSEPNESGAGNAQNAQAAKNAQPAKGGKRKRSHHKRTRRNKRKGTRRNKRKGTRRNKRN